MTDQRLRQDEQESMTWARGRKQSQPQQRGGCETNEAAERRPPVMLSVDDHPSAAAPVAAAFVFAEAEPFAGPPMPIVFMNDDTGFMGKVVRFMDVPARMALAYDRRGCAEGGRHDNTSADCGCRKDFPEHLNVSPLPFAPRTNHVDGFRFRDRTRFCETAARSGAEEMAERDDSPTEPLALTR